MDAEVMKAISEHTEATNGAANQFTTSNGIVFKLKPVAPLLIMDAQRQFREPEPPKVPNYDKGEGSDAPLEENPSDPKYLREMQDYRQKLGEIANAVYMTRGVEIISIPEGVDKVDDLDWSAEVTEFTGLEIPVTGRRRMYAWLKYVALTSMDDFQGLMNKLTTIGGVTLETDVTDAEKSFRPDESGNGVAGLPPGEEV